MCPGVEGCGDVGDADGSGDGPRGDTFVEENGSLEADGQVVRRDIGDQYLGPHGITVLDPEDVVDCRRTYCPRSVAEVGPCGEVG